MTDPSKHYNIRNKDTGRWLGTRKNGELYMKLFRPNANQYEGGTRLDAALAANPDCEAVEVED